MIEAAINNSLGIEFRTHPVRVIPRDRDYAKGEIAQFDLAGSDADTQSIRPGKRDSSLVNVVSPTATGKKYGVLVFFQQATKRDHEGYARLASGYFKGVSILGTTAQGDRLVASEDNNSLQAPSEAGEKVIAIRGEASDEIIAFDGSTGFGIYDTTVAQSGGSSGS